MKVNKLLLLSLLCSSVSYGYGQQPYVSKVWVADQRNGTYKNPIINADYSDPDAIRVGDDFYMVSSSFEDIPGLPILHSKDLVNWTIINHALKKQIPAEVFNTPQHGNGVWAPAIRYHNHEYYIYYPDPDFGIYMIKTKDPASDWSEPVLVFAGKGIIDPCPLWDDNGKAWLVHAYAGSRAGIKSVIAIAPMNTAGTAVTGEDKIVYDGHTDDPTIEGPKIYKRNGYYYIFAPAGGVSTGWQLVLRSKDLMGPYERKVVMDQGKSPVNGPHQGAWVTTQTGQNWFLHFQDKEAYGRVVHLQPMQWINDWPVIGVDKDHDGKGEPVMTYKKPDVGKSYPVQTPQESDEFNERKLGLQWQWEANSSGRWLMTGNDGHLRLYANYTPDAKNLWDIPNILAQKFPADQFVATTKVHFTANEKNGQQQAGLVVLGLDYAKLSIVMKDGAYILQKGICKASDKGNLEKDTSVVTLKKPEVWLRVAIYNPAPNQALCKFYYSLDGKEYQEISGDFTPAPGKWTGAKIGLFAIAAKKTNDVGYADFDFFRITPLNEEN
ncbi:glycoside hydrolase family 43 protein [Arachidicoccus terrestris]|uniref:glycoside hydrolase family 43 protein n=1 Tax=Arachidicoccus terrestris TaxID=2875539 RepID=UPI001CC524CC|nr:glycoside hydrolase 43 family protein [Arachidicoccus terrestris]UAY54533.1 glycoside hydrolase 43 family protein [Arachidicoccus terrestris]